MTEKLDMFRPDRKIASEVTRQLVDAGVPYEVIPHDWVDVSIAATLKWLTATRDGTEELVRMLGLQAHRGDSTKEYTVVDEAERAAAAVEPEDIWFIRGIVVKGLPVPVRRLSVADRDKYTCDDCYIVSHCPKEVAKLGVRLCNYCRSSHEDPHVREDGGQKVCEQCTYKICAHHPSNSSW